MITIDKETNQITLSGADGDTTHSLDSKEAFGILSDLWIRSGWITKYIYSFTWMGRPIIQLPDDMIRIQEVIYSVKPDVVVETGVAHGGSLIYYAGLMKAMGKGRVIGVDIEIRPHNRKAIEAHKMFPLITLIEGSSTDPDIVGQVRNLIKPGETVLVLLDSNHSKAHVLAELEAYSPLVTMGSYIVATDGVMFMVAGGPRTEPDWSWNNPTEAAREFAAKNPNFIIEQPPCPFNEGEITAPVTHWPDGYLKRIG